MTPLAARAAGLLGIAPPRAERLHGGDLSEVLRLHTPTGPVIAKAGPGAEARMLQALAAAGVPAPAVIATGDGVLILEDLGPDEGLEGGPDGAWADLGTVLRRLHSVTGPGYGWPEDHAFGPVEIANAPANAPAPDWPAFWAERRLLPACPHVAPDLARRIEALAARLPGLLPAAPPAALLHGDLWTGNVMARDGRVTGLIDPACFHGHAEVDLAMLRLFGRPGGAFRDSYGPPDPGAAERLPLYQLWPALVHLRLFGQGYRGLVDRCLSAVGA